MEPRLGGAQKEIHILGYGFDPYDERMLEFCRMRTMERADARGGRWCVNCVKTARRFRWIVHGAGSGGVVARPHVARALVEAGYANSERQRV
ncbi:MAG: hypothetical protein ACLUHE_04865 [Christensenellales bacterium]